MTCRAFPTIGALLLVFLACNRVTPQPGALEGTADAPSAHSSPPFHARVIDASTGDPIAGAVVVVLWRQIDISTGRWLHRGAFREEEVLTGNDGEFTLPRWGPRWVRRGVCLDRRDPEFWVIRRGYLLGYFDNEGRLDPRYFGADQTLPPGKLPPFRIGVEPGTLCRSHEPSRWNGKTLPLVPVVSPEQGRRSLDASNPIDPFDLSHPRLPQFWSEWKASAGGLPPEVARRLSTPPPLLREEEDEQVRRSMKIPR